MSFLGGGIIPMVRTIWYEPDPFKSFPIVCPGSFKGSYHEVPGLIFFSPPRFQCGFKIRCFCLNGLFSRHYIVTYTQWNSYFEVLSPGWIVLIQFVDRIAQRQFLVEKLLTSIFQRQRVSFQGVNTPKSLTTRPWKTDNWNTIHNFLLRDSVYIQRRQTVKFPGSNAPKLTLPWVFCSRYPTWGSDGKLYSPWTDGRVKVRCPEGEKGQQGGVEEGCFPFSFDVTKNWAF